MASQINITELSFWRISSLWSGDVIWRHRYGSIVAQVIACCLDQCWFVINEARWHLPESTFIETVLDDTHYSVFELTTLKILLRLPRADQLSRAGVAVGRHTQNVCFYIQAGKRDKNQSKFAGKTFRVMFCRTQWHDSGSVVKAKLVHYCVAGCIWTLCKPFMLTCI